MDAKTRKALQEFGFMIEEDGKHYRLTFFGDDRYNTTVAKTPSDARAGKNIAHYIEQTMMYRGKEMSKMKKWKRLPFTGIKEETKFGGLTV